MTKLTLAEVVPGAVDHGPIPEKADRMSGVYLGEQVVMTRIWTGHLFMVSTRDMIVMPHLINIGINEPHNTRTFISPGARRSPRARCASAGPATSAGSRFSRSSGGTCR